MARARRPHTGFTLIELLIVVALIAVVLTLAAPSFRNFILIQRLKSTNAQLVTDIQFARSEAVSRGVPVHFKVQGPASGMSCYVIYTTITAVTSTGPNAAFQCDCSRAEGLRCTAPAAEIRAVQLPSNLSVAVNVTSPQPPNFAFDPRNGGIQVGAWDLPGAPPEQFSVNAYIDEARQYRDTIGRSGRVQVCAPAGSSVGVAAC